MNGHRSIRRTVARPRLALCLLVALFLFAGSGARAHAGTLRVGDEVALYQPFYKRFIRLNANLRGDVSPVVSTATLPADWTWERFLVVDAGSGKVALYSAAHRAFLRVGDTGMVDAGGNATSLPSSWNWERFTVTDLGANEVRLTVSAVSRHLGITKAWTYPHQTYPMGLTSADSLSKLTVVVTKAAPVVPGSATDIAAATDAAKALPGFSLIADLLVAANAGVENGAYRIYSSDKLAAYAFQSSAWHAAITLKQPTTFTMPGVDRLGSINLAQATMIASAADEAVPVERLPNDLRVALVEYQSGGTLPLKRGINLFLAGTAGSSGALGDLKSYLGIGTEQVRLSGTIGDGVFARLLAAGGVTRTATSAEKDRVDMTLTLPSMRPAPFNTLTSADRDQFDLVISRTTLTASNQTNTDFAVTGTIEGTAVVAGQSAGFSGAVTVSGTGTSRRASFEVSVAKTISNLFGVSGLTLTGMGAKASITSGTRSIGLSATLRLGSGPTVTPQISTRIANGRLVEVNAGMAGSFTIPSSVLPPGVAGTAQISDPQIGFMPQQRAGYVSGTLNVTTSTGTLAATAVVMARTTGLTAILGFRSSGAKLSTVVGSSLGGAFDLPLPDLAAVGSTVAFAGPVSDLPAPAVKILKEDMGMAEGRTFDVPTGVSITAAVPATQLSSFGLSGPIVVSGSVKTSPLSVALSADLSTFTIPSSWNLPLQSVSPQLFLAISAGSVQIGTRMQLTFRDQNRDVTMSGSLAGIISSSAAPALALTATLDTDWIDPVGLSGITIKGNTGLTFTTDGTSVGIGMNGGVDFDGVTFGLGGKLSVQFASGIPTPKAFALRLSASELQLLTPVKVGQTMLRATANVAGNLVTKTGAALPSEITSALTTYKNNAGSIDLVGKVSSVVPQSGIAAELFALKFKDVELFISTPGQSEGTFPALDDVGVAIKGSLLRSGRAGNPDTTLAYVDSFLTLKRGFQLKAGIADVSIGPFALTGVMIDAGASIPYVQPDGPEPHLTVSGAASLGATQLAAVNINASSSGLFVDASLGIGVCDQVVTDQARHQAVVLLWNVARQRYFRIDDRAWLGSANERFSDPTDMPSSWRWERWRVLGNSDGTVSFYNVAQGRFMRWYEGTMNPSPPSDFTLPTGYNAERFRVVRSGDSVAFRTNDGKFVSMGADGGAYAADTIGSAEKFKIVQLGVPAPPTAPQCGDWGVRGHLNGTLTKDSATSAVNVTLRGNGWFEPPDSSSMGGVQLPRVGQSFDLDTSRGVKLGPWNLNVGGGSITVSGYMKSLSDWELTGTATIGAKSVDLALFTVKTTGTDNRVSATFGSSGASASADVALTVYGLTGDTLLSVPKGTYTVSLPSFTITYSYLGTSVRIGLL